MSARRGLGIALVLGAAFSVTGCVLYRGPRGVEGALERQLGVELHREFGIRLGWTSTHFVMAIARHEGDPDPDLDFDLDGIGVASYTIPAGARKVRLDPERLGLSGWDTTIRAHDADGDVLLMTRARRGHVREMIFVAVDGEDLVLGRFKGDLDALVEKMVSDTRKDGTRAARKALPASD